MELLSFDSSAETDVVRSSLKAVKVFVSASAGKYIYEMMEVIESLTSVRSSEC